MLIVIFDFEALVIWVWTWVTNFLVMPLSYCSQNLPLGVVYVPIGLDMQKAPLEGPALREFWLQ